MQKRSTKNKFFKKAAISMRGNRTGYIKKEPDYLGSLKDTCKI